MVLPDKKSSLRYLEMILCTTHHNNIENRGTRDAIHCLNIYTDKVYKKSTSLSRIAILRQVSPVFVKVDFNKKTNSEVLAGLIMHIHAISVTLKVKSLNLLLHIFCSHKHFKMVKHKNIENAL